MTELLDLAERVIARALPGEQIEAYVALGQELDIRAYGGEVESLSQATTGGVGVRLLATANGSSAPRLGFAWAGSLEHDVVQNALEQARDNARFAQPDPDLALAVPDGVAPQELDLWDASVAATAVDDKVTLTIALEREVKADARIRQVSSADYGDERVEVALASTTGIRSFARRTAAYLSASAIAGEGDDSHTGGGFSVARGFAGLDLQRAARDAVLRSTRMLGATKAASDRVTVVFDPRVVSTLLSVVSSALSGEAVVKGRSIFAGRVGEKVATGAITLIEDPTDMRAFAASDHDAEGLACRRKVLIKEGILQGFLYDTVSARRSKTASTASAVRGGFAGLPHPGCRALVLEPGDHDQNGIMAAVGEGLYVQSITGVHAGVDPVSGDFSVGVEGLAIRDGELAEPVREVTVASTLQRMLQSVLHVGRDVEWLPGIAAGQSLAIGEMQLSGV
ncbi:MAG: TldD/PmbA family protein [Acidimicrobiales bacterium]